MTTVELHRTPLHKRLARALVKAGYDVEEATRTAQQVETAHPDFKVWLDRLLLAFEMYVLRAEELSRSGVADLPEPSNAQPGLAKPSQGD